VPRHLTATGQGLAVAAHFCIGRSIGSIIAGALSSGESGKHIYNLFNSFSFEMSNYVSQSKPGTLCTNKTYKVYIYELQVSKGYSVCKITVAVTQINMNLKIIFFLM
jgi:patatin-like phospholipase/acyl hydrolase